MLKVLNTTLLILFLAASGFSQTRGMSGWVREATEQKKVCICGAVRNPSDIAIDKSLTLLQAIEGAGGVLPGSKKIWILRFHWVGEERFMIPIRTGSLKDIHKGKKPDQALELADVIIVTGGKNKDSKNFRPCVYFPMM